MFKYLLIVALIGAVCADDDAHAHVAKDYRKVDAHGHFEYGYDLTNGIGAEEAGDEHAVHGQYHFISKEGVPVHISYTADEHGYHPHGDLIPTPPPTPAAILKALKYIEEHPHKEEPVHPVHPKVHPVPVHPVHHPVHPVHPKVHPVPVHPVHHPVHPVHPKVHPVPVHPVHHPVHPVHPKVHPAPVHPVHHVAPVH